jgi:hypothetical protein
VVVHEDPQEMVARSNRVDPIVARILHSTDTRFSARAVHLHFILMTFQRFLYQESQGHNGYGARALY